MPTLSVSIRALPGLENRAVALAHELRSAPVQIVSDGIEPSARRGSPRPVWQPWSRRATHHLVLSGDVDAHPALLAQVRDAVRRQPAAVLSFFSGWDTYASHAVRIAAFAGRPWVAPPGKTASVVATVLPVAVAAELAAADDSAPVDDGEALFRVIRSRGLSHFASNPSLVQVADLRPDGAGAARAERATAFLPTAEAPAAWWAGDPLPTPMQVPAIHVSDGEPVSYEAPLDGDDRWRIRSRRAIPAPHSRRLTRIIRDRLLCTEVARSDLRAAASLLGAASVLCDQLLLAARAGSSPPEGFGELSARESAGTLPLGALGRTVAALSEDGGRTEVHAAFLAIRDDVLEVLDDLG
ncbi:hypothetical protein ACFV3I_07300 [Microbacterium sp. NPDC059771]|uniref:hypothetical protein n=1 Tax=Microbacterium sp. NPDC059771 TaxID=3346941 RepID=UPI0036508B27